MRITSMNRLKSPLSDTFIQTIVQKGRGSSKRGVSFQFGPDITQKFLQDNGLDYIIRSHEVKVNNIFFASIYILVNFLL